MSTPLDASTKAERRPFDNIALAFSGGGFRASSFSLGVLSYLHQVVQQDGRSLLGNVTFISSASGGTITNALYALSEANGTSFGAFYKQLTENITGTALLDTVFQILNDDKQWEIKPGKERNIINAFALAYDVLLFRSATLGDLNTKRNSGHLEEVCFNTTEFYRGLSFRQNIKTKFDVLYGADEHFRFGNGHINLDYQAAKLLKLSDLLAASSCFPAGFEPIVFPKDFTYTMPPNSGKVGVLNTRMLLNGLKVQLAQADEKELVRLYGAEVAERVMGELTAYPTPKEIESAFSKEQINDAFSIGMVDGGITDNQALESLLAAQKRRKCKATSFAAFDLMLINDVGSHFMDPYVPPGNGKSYTGINGITINTVLLVLFIVLGGGAALLVCGFVSFFSNALYNQLSLVIGTKLFVLAGLALALIFFIRGYVKGTDAKGEGLNLKENFSDDIVKDMFRYFGATPVLVVLRMLRERLSSVLLLNNDVFLKRIRYLLFREAYEKNDYELEMKSNHIYDLAFSNDQRRLSSDLPYTPSVAMQIVAQSAFKMPTTLWYDTKSQKADTMAAVVACGQYSTCFNLLEYIYRLKHNSDGKYYDDLSTPYKSKVDHLEHLLIADLEKFKADPFWLYNDNGRNFGIDGFRDATMVGRPMPEDFVRLREKRDAGC